jgi:hypothetical protein
MLTWQQLKLQPDVTSYSLAIAALSDAGQWERLGGLLGTTQAELLQPNGFSFSAAIAAVVASPTAVVTWRVSWARTSPAAKKPTPEEAAASRRREEANRPMGCGMKLFLFWLGASALTFLVLLIAEQFKR